MQKRITFIPPNGLQITGENGHLGYPVLLSYLELNDLSMNRVRWNWHPEIEIFLIVKGEADFLAEDKKIHLKTGQGMLVNQNVMHSIHGMKDETVCGLYSLKFHPSFLFGYGNTMLSGKYLAPILSSPSMRIVELLGQDNWHETLLDITKQVITANQEKKYGYELETKALLCHLWNVLLERIVPENVNKVRQTNVSLDETRVKEAILYIEAHYHEHITLDELAASIHISKSECCRCFKRTLQVTPFEYLMKYRIFRATNILQNDEPEGTSISALAFNVGFNNVSYFNKLFKQYMNCTPSEYKRKVKTDPTKEVPEN